MEWKDERRLKERGNNMKEYLPIGTIVKVKDVEKKIMIVGISQVREIEDLERWD